MTSSILRRTWASLQPETQTKSMENMSGKHDSHLYPILKMPSVKFNNFPSYTAGYNVNVHLSIFILFFFLPVFDIDKNKQ